MRDYVESDFKVITNQRKIGNPEILFSFESKDGRILANFFWLPDNVQMRILVDDNSFTIGYPFSNKRGMGIKPKHKTILRTLILHLRRRGVKHA